MAGPGDMARGTAGGAMYMPAAGIDIGLCSGAGAGGGLPSSIEATPMDARLLAACARARMAGLTARLWLPLPELLTCRCTQAWQCPRMQHPTTSAHPGHLL